MSKFTKKEIQTLANGLLAVQELIQESCGVWGLHQNGKDEEWSELLNGGYHEVWLLDFSDAIELVNEKLLIKIKE